MRPLPFPLGPGALLAAALLLASGAEGSEAGRSEKPGKEGPPNLVLITLDTTRADHLGAYGWRWARTPNLDALAARGVRFERCDSAAPTTLPSHASLLTGLYPPRHGVRDNGSFRLPGEARTVTEILRERGYDTAAVVAAVVLKARFGLDQGFRAYDDELPGDKAPGEVAEGDAAQERPAGAVTERALDLLAGLRPPFFLWVHYYDPHGPYRAPPEVRRDQRGPHPDYDAEIAYLDRELGRLLAALPTATAVAVAGDHGEMLGEHGESTHGILLHAGARRVPLLLAGPTLPAGRRVRTLVRTVDLAPTLLELAAAPVPEGLDGESLLLLLGGEVPGAMRGADTASRLSYSESLHPFLAYRWHPLRALSDGEELFVDGARPRLFDLDGDPEEARDLAPRRPEAVQAWLQRLETLRSGWPEEEAEARATFGGTQEERRALAALGYLGGGPAPASSRDHPDPYPLVDIAGRLHELVPRVNEGGCGRELLEELQAILRRHRGNPPALSLAGLCLMGRGEYGAALPYLERAVALTGGNASDLANLAGCLQRLGRPGEAEAAYRRALEVDPSSSQAAARLAALLRRGGEPARALKVLAALPPGATASTEVLVERGLARAELGRLEAALADFDAALALAPEHPVALENAARAAFQLRRPRRAAELYRRLLAREPGRGDLWKTLGAVELYALGRPTAARASFLRALELEADPLERRELEEVLRRLGEP